tara:strand:- start:104550 stop:104699 length:150 start_codon:yes stop_codon:yes gene_type:complete
MIDYSEQVTTYLAAIDAILSSAPECHYTDAQRFRRCSLTSQVSGMPTLV